MDGPILRAEPRTVLGKKVKALRRQGKIPGVVYGPVLKETVQIQVDRRELERLYHRLGYSTLFSLNWDGFEQPVFIREVQIDPVRRSPLHVDFFAPNLRQELSVAVPLNFRGADPPAETALTTSHTELTIRGLPTELPHQLDVDLSGLREVGDVLRAGDIPLAQGLTLETSADDVVAQLSAVTAPEPEEVEAEAEAAEAPVEGADLVAAAEGEVAEAVAGEGGEGES
jgi:large subunit ribosomal protein L25